MGFALVIEAIDLNRPAGFKILKDTGHVTALHIDRVALRGGRQDTSRLGRANFQLIRGHLVSTALPLNNLCGLGPIKRQSQFSSSDQ